METIKTVVGKYENIINNCLEQASHSAVYTPGIYEVYRGYIVFEFSVKMFVCVCVCV